MQLHHLSVGIDRAHSWYLSEVGNLPIEGGLDRERRQVAHVRRSAGFYQPPLAHMATRSQSDSTSLRMCEAEHRLPVLLGFLHALANACSMSGSRPDVGSSRTSRRPAIKAAINMASDGSPSNRPGFFGGVQLESETSSSR